MKDKITKTNYIFFSVLIIAFFFTQKSFSQCSNCGSNYPPGTFTTTSSSWTNITTCQYGSEYSYGNLETGYIYQWSTEGTSWDTQLTLYPSTTCGSPAVLAYNDDYTPPGNYLSLIAYQPGTTSIRVLVSQYNCISNITCGTTKWRRIPTNPTISASSTTICNGQSVTLTASNISGDDNYIDIRWGTTNGGTEISADAYSVILSPTTTTTYYLQYFVKGGTSTNYSSVAGIYSNSTSITITVNQLSSPPESATASPSTICPGANVTLSYSGGSLGSGAVARWYSGSCGGTLVGTGNNITVSPTTTTTYYVRFEGTCNTTSCASVTVNVNTLSTTPSSINAVVNP